MNPAITIWLDPGKTTGAAVWYHDQQSFHSTQGEFQAIGNWLELLALYTPGPRKSGAFRGRMADIYQLPACEEERYEGIRIGWERYIVTPGNSTHGIAYYSLETIGMARWIALKYEMEILPPQVSSQMAIATDERLKAIEWYKPGRSHANDASRHLLRYFIASKTLPDDLTNKLFGGVSEGH